MRVKVSKLSGQALDWAVAESVQCDEIQIGEHGICCIYEMADGSGCWTNIYSPSTDWSQGGPLIERFRVTVSPYWPSGMFCASSAAADSNNYVVGENYLVAACRAIVSAKLGDEVEVPEALL